jgi:AraC family transcriptional regulator
MAASRFFQSEESGLGIQVFRHECPISFPEHSHREAALVVCTEGILESTQFGRREFLHAGQVLFTNSYTPHASSYCVDGKPTCGVTLEFDPLVLRRLGYNGGSPYLLAEFLGKMNVAEVANLSRLIQDESLRLQPDSAPMIAALAGQVLALALRRWPRTLIRRHESKQAVRLPRNELVRSIEFMQVTPARDFSVHEVARHLHRSTSTFSRLFTWSVGVSPYRYYLTTVIDRAADRLANTEEPVKHIALTLGFNSVSHFSSAFRQKWNMTPTAFRHNASPIYNRGTPPFALPES